MTLLAALCSVALFAAPLQVGPREPLAQRPLRLLEDRSPAEGVEPDPKAAGSYRLVVKFEDAVRARVSEAGALVSRSGANLVRAREIVALHGLTVRPGLASMERKLALLEERAAARSGRAQPDLAGMVRLEGAEGLDAQVLLDAARALGELEEVEFTWVAAVGQPPPGFVSQGGPGPAPDADPAPPTPGLWDLQTYRQPDPGLAFDQAEAEGWNGAGVRIADCEYAWKLEHEDLDDVDVFTEPGQTPIAWASGGDQAEHGTAALGVLAAEANGFGCTGLASGASFATYPEWTEEAGERRVECIASAIADSAPGDIVLLEMQTSAGGFFDYVPAEYDPDVFLVVQVGTAAGVVVVASAGNGGVDLDDAEHADYAAMGASGALLVGAGTSDTTHAAWPLSTFGSRIDVQGWGENVFSLGYGDYAAYGLDPLQSYTDGFSGTSSAAALVAGAAAVVQQKARARNGVPLSPSELRDLLVAEGIDQAPGPEVGPLPDVAACLEWLESGSQPSPFADLGGGLAGSGGVPALSGAGLGAPGSAFSLEVGGALAGAAMIEVIGHRESNLPLFGGVVIPSVDFLRFGLSTDGSGGFAFQGAFGKDLDPGTSVYVQYWIVDPGGPQGMAATNGLHVVIS